MELGRLGVFQYLDQLDIAQATAQARTVERLGYSTLWFPETFGRDPFALATHLLANTEKLVVATAVANIWKREPLTMMGGARTVAELFPGRFILGMGVGAGAFMHRHGLPYEKPYSAMREYLAKMKAAPYQVPHAPRDPPIVLDALLPKMCNSRQRKLTARSRVIPHPSGLRRCGPRWVRLRGFVRVNSCYWKPMRR